MLPKAVVAMASGAKRANRPEGYPTDQRLCPEGAALPTRAGRWCAFHAGRGRNPGDQRLPFAALVNGCSCGEWHGRGLCGETGTVSPLSPSPHPERDGCSSCEWHKRGLCGETGTVSPLSLRPFVVGRVFWLFLRLLAQAGALRRNRHGFSAEPPSLSGARCLQGFVFKRLFGKRSASVSSVVSHRTRRAVHSFSCGLGDCPSRANYCHWWCVSACRGAANTA